MPDQRAAPFGLITAATLRARLGSGDDVPLVIDARTRGEYERGHIPGALWLGWEDFCERAPVPAGSILAEDGYWGGLAGPPAAVAERLARAGIRSDRALVIYADGPRSRGREGRVAWMLLYLGAAGVYLLDRGWRGWLAHGGAVETRHPLPPLGSFALDLQEQRRIRLPALKQCYLAGQLPLFVDTRSREEFHGDLYPYLPRRGRLPGAVLFPFADLFDAAQSFVTPASYLERLPEAARGVRGLVTYCEVGVRASLTSLLHELATGAILPVFDGSLIAWSLDAELPVECGPVVG